MKAQTFDAWKLAGYRVKKGAKATGRDPRTGDATFTREQVEEDDAFDRRGHRDRDD